MRKDNCHEKEITQEYIIEKDQPEETEEGSLKISLSGPGYRLTRLARHFRRRVRRRMAALFADAKSSFTITMCVVTTLCQLVFLN